ncbi:hypothetical protein CAL7716_101260 (plasmid) [Calothrix sp. PCC 7716]|nr:hypothetical protein CAL7716_101260 [Calothrix sp. PCC 7716]
MNQLTTLAMGATFGVDALVINCPDWCTAKLLARKYESQFARWAKVMNKSETILNNPEKPVRIPATIDADDIALAIAPSISSQEQGEREQLVWFANCCTSKVLLRIALELTENPVRRGVVRLSDELQVIMADECKILNPGHTLEEATTWRRPQFWHPQDLIDFRRICQQELRDDGSNVIEYTWRSFDPDLGLYDASEGNWLTFTTRYRLLYDSIEKQYYQICDNLGMSNAAFPKEFTTC